jgi:endoglucanase
MLFINSAMSLFIFESRRRFNKTKRIWLIALSAALITLTASFIGWSAQANPSVKEGESHEIYNDGLVSGWRNWSWRSVVNFRNSNPTHTGNHSISFLPSPWGGFYLNKTSAFNTSDYSGLMFSLYPSGNDQDYLVMFYDENNTKISREVRLSELSNAPKTRTWNRYYIPFSVLGGSVERIKGFAIQEAGNVSIFPTYIDNISLVRQKTEDVFFVYKNGLDPEWGDWSWDSMIDLNESNVRFEDQSSISFTQRSAWAGMYFNTPTPLNINNYNYLTFAARGAQDGFVYRAALYGTDNEPITEFIHINDFGGSLNAGNWTIYNIPLNVLNPDNKEVRGLAIHDGVGRVQGPAYFTNIGFSAEKLSGGGGQPADPSSPDRGNDDLPKEPKDNVPAPIVPVAPVTPTPPSSNTGGRYRAVNNKIYRDGSVVQLRGVSWFGFETETNVVHGLWVRNWKDMVSQMKSLNINAVRVPFCPPTLRGVQVNSIDYSRNEDLRGLNSLQLLDRVMEELSNQRMHILLDHHTPDCKVITPLWYTNSYSENQWIQDLRFIAERYRNNPYFMGIDIKNEPQGNATWGTGNVRTDWNTAAEKAGREILSVNNNILIFVQGIQSNPTCSSNSGHWWGGNMEPINCTPLSTSAIPSDKLVYSPHVYGPDVYYQPYFAVSNFPRNMPEIWERHFGFLVNRGYTVVPGEWGGRYGNGGHSQDRAWQDAIVEYYKSKGICNTFYWSWNPNSTDTHGILQNDWRTPWQNKVNMLNNFYNSCR